MFQTSEQTQTQDQQVITALRQTNNSLTQQLVGVKIAGTIADTTMLTVCLVVITVVRFIVRRRRLAGLAGGAHFYSHSSGR